MIRNENQCADAMVSVVRRVAAEQDETVKQELFAELLPLMADFRPRLKAIAHAQLPDVVRNKLEASDLVQETFLRGFRQLEQFHGATDAEFAGWLRGILRNQIIDVTRYHGRRIRDSRREQPLPDDLPCHKAERASEVARRSETHERLRNAIGELSEDHRQVILLRQEEDLTFEELGRRMGRSADAARMLWGRALVQLSRLLQSERSDVVHQG